MERSLSLLYGAR